jgi:hypothetical protein
VEQQRETSIGEIQTVLGPVPADMLGATYSHEHLIAVPPASQEDRDLELSDYDKSLQELLYFKEAGGQTLVEASTLDYGRNVELLRRDRDNLQEQVSIRQRQIEELNQALDNLIAEEAAIRETMEEACLKVDSLSLLGVPSSAIRTRPSSQSSTSTSDCTASRKASTGSGTRM